MAGGGRGGAPPAARRSTNWVARGITQHIVRGRAPGQFAMPNQELDLSSCVTTTEAMDPWIDGFDGRESRVGAVDT
eukprot:scaffold28410_cov112-Isochrysis_galbana.AAC.2